MVTRLALRRACAIIVGTLALLGIAAVTRAPVAPVSVTVPYSGTVVSDADLDGDPATGVWADSLSVEIPLENGAGPPYDSAILHAKQDGTYVYFRVDGKIDVPWTSAGGNHFWFGALFSPASVTGHHRAGQDGVFFGDSTYTTATPLFPVDTDGARPPIADASQDDLGEMRASGTSPPYSFTAEWKRMLVTGDAADVAFTADGNTTYSFYVTTDSDGAGSGGGAVPHNGVTNTNVVKFAVPTPGGLPSSSVGIVHTPSKGVIPGVQIYVVATLTNASAATVAWRNGTMTADERVPLTNLSQRDGDAGWMYAGYLPAQATPTQVRYSINASGPDGYRIESFFLTVAFPTATGITPEKQEAWILSVAASLAMAISVVAVMYWYTGRRLRREGK